MSTGPVDPGLVNDDFASLPASPPMAFDNPSTAIAQAARITCRIFHPASGRTLVESNVILPLVGRRRRQAQDESSTDSSDSSDDEDVNMEDDQGLSNENRRAYWIQKTIRKAIYGKVKMGVVLRPRRVVPPTVPGRDPEAEWETTNEYCAIKEMEWARIRSARGRLAENPIGEVGALNYMRQVTQQSQIHPQHVLIPLDLLSDETYLYLISPYCNGGELFDVLETREKFTETEARFWMRQVLKGLGELQTMGLCHRDLSLENLMVNDQSALVIDFGMCFRVPYAESALVSRSGNPPARRRLLVQPSGTMGKWHYMSPEIVRNRDPFDGFSIDLWAAGVILFLMLTGFPPWEKADDSDDRFKYMSRGYMVQLLTEWNLGLSQEAMELLQSMLYKDPRRRLSLQQVWQHPWLQIDTNLAEHRI